jgi:hypothetical protein
LLARGDRLRSLTLRLKLFHPVAVGEVNA